MVALLHAGQATYFSPTGQRVPLVGATTSGELNVWRLLLQVLGNGHGAVIFFFVLSGFVLTLMLHRASHHAAKSTAQFAIGRVFRIYPAAICTIAIFTLTFLLTGGVLAPPASFTTTNIVANALLLSFDINGVMWSLQLEVLAAPMIFALYWLWRSIGISALVVPLAVLAGLSFAKTWTNVLGPPVNIGNLYCFVAGMVTCVVAPHVASRTSHPRRWLFVMVLGFAATRPLLGWWSLWSVVFETVFAAGVIAFLAFGDIRWSSQSLLARIVRYYGRISYSFYLLHPLTLAVMWTMQAPLTIAVGAGIPTPLLALGLFVASTLAITPLAHAQYLLVEQPGVAAGHVLQRPFRNRGAPPATVSPNRSIAQPE